MAVPVATVPVATAVRSSSNPENAIILCGLIVVSTVYLLAAAIRRKIHERRTNERKRRLLGIPTTPTPTTSKPADVSAGAVILVSTIVDTLRDLLMPYRNRYTHRISNKLSPDGKKGSNDASSGQSSKANGLDGAIHASTSSGGDSKKRSNDNHASLAREIRGRATLIHDGLPPSTPSETFVNTNNVLTSAAASTSRNSSRSVSASSSVISKHSQSHTARIISASRLREHNKKDNDAESTKQKEKSISTVRSVGVQVPPDDEKPEDDENVDASQESQQNRPHVSTRQDPVAPPPPYVEATISTLIKSGPLRPMSSPTGREFDAAVQQEPENRQSSPSIETPIYPSSPSIAAGPGTSPSRTSRKARAAINRQVSRASVPGMTPSTLMYANNGDKNSDSAAAHSSRRYQDGLDSSSTSAPLAESPSTSAIPSRESSLPDGPDSPSLVEGSSSDFMERSGIDCSAAKPSSANATTHFNNEQRHVQPYCFHTGFQNEYIENDAHPRANSFQQLFPQMHHQYLPTPPQSERKFRTDENGYPSIPDPAFDAELTSTPPFTPVAVRSIPVRSDNPFANEQSILSMTSQRQYSIRSQQQQTVQHDSPASQIAQHDHRSFTQSPSPSFPSLSATASASSRSSSPLPDALSYPHIQPAPYDNPSTHPMISHHMDHQQAQPITTFLDNMQLVQAQLYHAAHAQAQAQVRAQYLAANSQQTFQPGIQPHQPLLDMGGMPTNLVPVPVQGQSTLEDNQHNYLIPISPSFPLAYPYNEGAALGHSPAMVAFPPISPYAGSSTSWADGTVTYYSNPRSSSTSASAASNSSSGPSRRRQMHFANASPAITSPSPHPPSNHGRKSNKRERRASRSSGCVDAVENTLASPSLSNRESLGSERLDSPSLHYNSRKPSNTSRRRNSRAHGPPLPVRAVSRAEAEDIETGNDSGIQADLEVIANLENDEGLCIEELRRKMKSMEVVLERRGKELEIARWRLRCIEVERKGIDVQHQKALSYFSDRAQKAEARVRLLESDPSSNPSSLSSNVSDSVSSATNPTASPPPVLQDEEWAAEILEDNMDPFKLGVAVTPSKTERPFLDLAYSVTTPNIGSGEFRSAASMPYSPATSFNSHYPPYPFISKPKSSRARGRRNKRNNEHVYTPLDFTRRDSLSPGPPTSTSFSSNGSFDYNTHQDEDQLGDEEDDDDLEIVLDSSCSKSPGFAPAHFRPPVAGTLLYNKHPTTVGLGMSTSSGSSESDDKQKLFRPVTYIGSLPSFKFSLPPLSPTRQADDAKSAVNRRESDEEETEA